MTSSSDPSRTTAPSRRAWLRPVVVGVLLGWVVASAVAALEARTLLGDAQQDLAAVARNVRDLEVADASTAASRASERLEAADDTLGAPWLTPWRAVPVASRNLRAARTVADRALAVTTSGRALLDQVDAAATLATERRTGSPLPVATVADLAVPMAELAEVAAEASVTVRRLDSGALVPPLRDAVATFAGQAGTTAEQALTARDATTLAADLLGSDGPRRLFVGAATPAELRGTGGLIGAWSILELEDGEFSFQPFRRIFDLVFEAIDAPVEPPSSDYADRYGQFEALSDWRNTTMTPDFPSAAVVMERLWEVSNPDAPVDGVLVIDPVAFEVLAAGTGPLTLASGIEVRPGEVVDFVTNGAYTALPDDRSRREAIGEVATASLQRLVDRLDRGDLTATFAAFAGLFGSGHAQLHVVEPGLQELVADLGIGGGLTDPGGDVVGLALNNAAGNKVDYWLDQRWDVRVAPVEGGASTTTLDVTLRNLAPSTGFSQEVLGPFLPTLGPGESLLMASAFCSPRCTVTAAPGTAAASTDRELGFGIDDHFVALPPDGLETLSWELVQDGSWSFVDGRYRHVVRVVVPPTVRPADVVVTVELPATVVPRDLPDGARLAGDTVEWQPGAGASILVIDGGPGEPPTFVDALLRPASSLF